MNNYLTKFPYTILYVIKKIIHSTDTNTEKCRGCYFTPHIPPSGWLVHSSSSFQSLAAEGSHLITPLGILPSTKLPQLRLCPLPVWLENQSQPSNFNLDLFWRATPTPEFPESPSQSHLRQRSWIKSSKHYIGKAVLYCTFGKLPSRDR